MPEQEWMCAPVEREKAKQQLKQDQTTDFRPDRLLPTLERLLAIDAIQVQPARH